MSQQGTKTVGFIGAGNMAEAIAGGLAKKSGEFSIVLSDINRERVAALAEKFSATPAEGNIECIDASDVVVLAVKPQNFEQVMGQIKNEGVGAGKLFISIAAGVPIEYIESFLPENASVVRVMPNLPCLVGQGVLGYCAGTNAGERELGLCRRVLESVGVPVLLERESDLDAVTGLSGSGPAFVFAFVKGLIDGGVASGLTLEQSRKLAFGTVAGSLKLLEQSGQTPAEMIVKVASKGGTTERGLEVLAKQGMEDAVSGAVKAATERSVELAKGFGA